MMARLQVMLAESDIKPDSDWSTVQGQLSSLAAFTAVKSDEDRRQLFQEYTGDLQVSISHSQSVAATRFGAWTSITCF